MGAVVLYYYVPKDVNKARIRFYREFGEVTAFSKICNRGLKGKRFRQEFKEAAMFVLLKGGGD